MVNSLVIFSSDSTPKLNWMYKDKADNEEYLLGRRIDKTMIVEEETPATGMNPFMRAVWLRPKL